MRINGGNLGGVPGLSVGGFCVAKIFSSVAQKKSRLTTRLKTRFVAPCPNGVPEALAKAGRRPQFSPVVSRSGAAIRCFFLTGGLCFD